MKQLQIMFFITVTALSCGCATQSFSTHKHVPAGNYATKNEKIVDKQFDETWDIFVRELSKSFYVINNIDKNSRVINVSFSTDHPERYIDCGTSYRTFKRGAEEENYTYPTASSSRYKLAGGRRGDFSQFDLVINMNRRTNLEGRINMYLAPVEEKKCQVLVNSKFVFTLKTSNYNQLFNPANIVISDRNESRDPVMVSFTTKEIGQLELSANDSIVCKSKGVLEEEILSLVK